MIEMEDLKDAIVNILINDCEVSDEVREYLIEKIMDEVQKYSNTYDAAFLKADGKIKELKKDKEILVDKNIEYQRKLECIEFILGGNFR